MNKSGAVLNEVIDQVESLNEDEHEIVLSVVSKRLREKRRKEIQQEIAAAKQDYETGAVTHGSADDLMNEILSE